MHVKRPKVVQFIHIWSKVCCPYIVPLNRILIRLVKMLIGKNLSGFCVLQRRETEKDEWNHLKDASPANISPGSDCFFVLEDTMDSLPQEIVARVCTFLYTVSLCQLCGASKALRTALKDDPDAWNPALQSTWWYHFDTLGHHDNFTFWCSQYPSLSVGGKESLVVAL